MNTKLLMITSAVFLGLIGISFLFLPQEIAAYFNLTSNTISTLFLTIIGALNLGFAMLNWMAKGNIMGGIYSRPVAVGNLMHFMVVAISLLKIVFKPLDNPEIVIALTVLYSVFAAAFGYVFMTNPSSKSS